MKWSDLSFKEKKQIYDSIKAQNPDTTYLDIKSQFDSIPAYEDGGKKIMPPKELGLTPGTPEYYKRQQQISGKASTVQPEAYITPAGYVKDAINFVEDLSNGDYTGAAVDAALNIIPWGVGKTLKKFKSKVGRLIEGTDYEKAYSDIAYKEITGRKDYVSYGSMGDNIYGKANMKNIQDGFTSSNVDDYSIVLDPSTYIPGTANHELGHIADGIAGSIKYEAEPGVDYITNPYLRYVDENMILDYFRSGKANGAVRNQYDLYIDKQRYIDRLNRLVPMEWLLPTIGLGGAEFLREKQNNKSN